MKRKNWLIAIIGLMLIFSLMSFDVGDEGITDDVLKQTNKFRKSEGLTELVLSDELNAIAQKHSEHMANGSVAFGHDGFEERFATAKEKIKQINSLAENVAYGPTTGKDVVELWQNSSGHRRNMLGQYKYIGIGIAQDSQGRFFYTQIFAG